MVFLEVVVGLPVVRRLFVLGIMSLWSHRTPAVAGLLSCSVCCYAPFTTAQRFRRRFHSRKLPTKPPYPAAPTFGARCPPSGRAIHQKWGREHRCGPPAQDAKVTCCDVAVPAATAALPAGSAAAALCAPGLSAAATTTGPTAATALRDTPARELSPTATGLRAPATATATAVRAAAVSAAATVAPAATARTAAAGSVASATTAGAATRGSERADLPPEPAPSGVAE